MTNTDIIEQIEQTVNNEVVTGQTGDGIADFFRFYNMCSQDLNQYVNMDKRIIIPKDFINKATNEEEISGGNYRSSIPVISNESTNSLNNVGIIGLSNGAQYVNRLGLEKDIIVISFVPEMKDMNIIGLVNENSPLPYVYLPRVEQTVFSTTYSPCYFYDNTENKVYIRDPKQTILVNFYGGIKDINTKKIVKDDDYFRNVIGSEPEISYDFHSLYIYYYTYNWYLIRNLPNDANIWIGLYENLKNRLKTFHQKEMKRDKVQNLRRKSRPSRGNRIW